MNIAAHIAAQRPRQVCETCNWLERLDPEARADVDASFDAVDAGQLTRSSVHAAITDLYGYQWKDSAIGNHFRACRR